MYSSARGNRQEWQTITLLSFLWWKANSSVPVLTWRGSMKLIMFVQIRWCLLPRCCRSPIFQNHGSLVRYGKKSSEWCVNKVQKLNLVLTADLYPEYPFEIFSKGLSTLRLVEPLRVYACYGFEFPPIFSTFVLWYLVSWLLFSETAFITHQNCDSFFDSFVFVYIIEHTYSLNRLKTLSLLTFNSFVKFFSTRI